ncbi:VOC family protein [Nocardioides bruguierae]|uniref:VOC family protein n=1 Tax=Nocardioides bruguierae TaxID=2945102 RepID=UPI0035570EC9
MSTIANLTIHCRDAETLSAFWATALGWKRETADGSATLTDPDARHSAWYLENASDLGSVWLFA